MKDLFNMMGKMKEMQEKMQEAQKELEGIVVHGEAGGGMVKVTVNGQKLVQSIDVDDSLISDNDKTMLQDLIVAATNNALSNADEKIKEELQKKTEGMMPNIPGFDFGNLNR